MYKTTPAQDYFQACRNRFATLATQEELVLEVALAIFQAPPQTQELAQKTMHLLAVQAWQPDKPVDEQLQLGRELQGGIQALLQWQQQSTGCLRE
jgi:hypothetical protein